MHTMSNTVIQLERIEGFHVGGSLRMLSGFPPQRRYRNDGAHMVGQMYAQHFRLAQPRHEIPIALWHGGGLTGASWETTPDGRAGWLDYFLRAGFSAYLCDSFERGRSSLPPPPAFSEPPEYRALDAIWHHFRFGAAQMADAQILRNPRAFAYAGQQFPVQALWAFGQQFAPRFSDSDREILAAYAAFLERVHACCVVGHSQGGLFAVRSALAHRDRIRAVVALEPPLDDACIATLAQDDGAGIPPHLFIFGDYIRGVNRFWEPFLENAEKYCEMLTKHGVRNQWIELPRIGIHGNSHMLQMDENNYQIAKIVTTWLDTLEMS